MGSQFYRVKIGLYVLVIAMVGTLFGVRVNNAWLKTNYVREVIFRDGDIEISLHYPAKILSPKIDTNYPLTLSFYYRGDTKSPHTYEILLQSPTLLFVDAKGADITPHFQFTSSQAFYEQSVYVRPYLSKNYYHEHIIIASALIDGKQASTQPQPIGIEVEPFWLSFLSLAAVSLVEISVATALITWIVNAIDASSTARKERVARTREELAGLSSLPYLEQMDKVSKLEDEVNDEHLDDDVRDGIQSVKRRFKEEEFFRVVGEKIQQNVKIDFPPIQKLHERFYPSSRHKDSIELAGKILVGKPITQEDALPFVSTIVKIWDDFDTGAKDLIVGTLKQLAQKVVLSSIPAGNLLTWVFHNNNRRRLLRDVEIKTLFPQLDSAPPVGYNAQWLHLPTPPVNPRVVEWLKKHDLVANPFSAGDFENYPFYPEGFLRPDHWEDFLISNPQRAQCPSPEDAKALAFLSRLECLPIRKLDDQGQETISSGRQIFPVWVSFEQTVPSELPLVTLTRSAARAWLDILPFSPDAMLDLAPADQVALLELLCWVFGSNHVVINFLKRANLKDNHAPARLLAKKISEFKSEISSVHLPQDYVLISWLKIRPPDLNYTCLILSFDEFSLAARTWWLEQFSPLISMLFLHGIVVKAFSSSHISLAFPLSEIRLNWSRSQLKKSLDSQFNLAVEEDKETNKREKEIKFSELFGPSGSVNEKDTTNKLISASHNSLARMLNLGNRLLQYHCEHRTIDGVPEKYLHIEDLETILNSA